MMKLPPLTAGGSHMVYLRSLDESDVWTAELN